MWWRGGSIGRATLYQLDRTNEVVKQLIKLDMAVARKAMEKEWRNNFPNFNTNQKFFLW